MAYPVHCARYMWKDVVHYSEHRGAKYATKAIMPQSVSLTQDMTMVHLRPVPDLRVCVCVCVCFRLPRAGDGCERVRDVPPPLALYCRKAPDGFGHALFVLSDDQLTRIFTQPKTLCAVLSQIACVFPCAYTKLPDTCRHLPWQALTPSMTQSRSGMLNGKAGLGHCLDKGVVAGPFGPLHWWSFLPGRRRHDGGWPLAGAPVGPEGAVHSPAGVEGGQSGWSPRCRAEGRMLRPGALQPSPPPPQPPNPKPNAGPCRPCVCGTPEEAVPCAADIQWGRGGVVMRQPQGLTPQRDALEGGGGTPPPPLSRAPSLRPATVWRMATARFTGICNRQ